MTLKSNLNVEDMPEFWEFCEIRELAENTINHYSISLNKYIAFTGKTLKELLEEAEEEEDAGIRMRRRKIKNYLTQFKMALKKEEYSERYIDGIMIDVKAFYNENDIMLPRSKRKSRSDRKPRNFDDLPTMEEIERFMEYANTTYRAIATVMLSSAMSRAEILSLTFDHFYKAIPLNRNPNTMEDLLDKLDEHKNTVLFWKIERVKTKHSYFTFTSPEATINIIKYLEGLHNHFPDYNPQPEDVLFRHNNVPITKGSVSQMFSRINKRAGLRKVDEKILVRPHSLRKFFATTLEKNRMPHLSTRFLMGHTIDDTTASYFYADPDTLRYEYTEVLDYIQTNKVETVIVNQYEEIRQDLDKVIENQERIKSLIKDAELSDEFVDYISRVETKLKSKADRKPTIIEEEINEIIRKSEEERND